MTGITLITVLALLCGFLAHVLKQLIAARLNQATMTLRDYFIAHWPETVFALIFALIGYLAIPELSVTAPDFAKTIGLGEKQTVLSSAIVGFMSNSLADFVGGRARSIGGK